MWPLFHISNALILPSPHALILILILPFPLLFYEDWDLKAPPLSFLRFQIVEIEHVCSISDILFEALFGHGFSSTHVLEYCSAWIS